MSTAAIAFGWRTVAIEFIGKLIEILECIRRKCTKPYSERLTYDTSRELNAPSKHPVKAFGWAARDKSGVLSPFKFSRRATGENDITLKVLYCGISHTDLHFVKNEWGLSNYPLVPGHEIVGIVTELGSKVLKFKVGDKVGVGSLIASCRKCEMCEDGFENFCPNLVATYNATYYDQTPTYGGFSDIMVVDEHFAIRWPDQLPLHSGAPLLCAGIAVYSPLKYCDLNRPGMHVGVVGLGGLGHLAVKFAKAFGAKVTVISTTPSKKTQAKEHLGADDFLVIHDQAQMDAAAGTMDGILYTASAVHPLKPLIAMLKYRGVLVMLGAPERPFELPALPLLLKRKIVAGSSIGGMEETEEMINFAAQHNITADVEVISMDYVNIAMASLAQGNVRFRFVIDIGNSLKDS